MKAALIFAVLLFSPLPTFEIAGNQNANLGPQTGGGNQAASINPYTINQAGNFNGNANIGPQTGGGNQAASINQAGNRSAKGSGIQLPPVETFGPEHRQNANRKRAGGATRKITNRKMQFGGQSANNNANINQAGGFVGGNANIYVPINQAGGFGEGNANGGGNANASINQAGGFVGGNANVDQPTSQSAPDPEVDQHEPFF